MSKERELTGTELDTVVGGLGPDNIQKKNATTPQSGAQPSTLGTNCYINTATPDWMEKDHERHF